jgi:hypothetical protein
LSHPQAHGVEKELLKMNIFHPQPRHRISEAAAYRNLAIYLLHLPPAAPDRFFLTLEEALRTGCARVHETGRVGEVEIENLTGADLYAQAGDVVKGGWQDRALGLDCIVPHRARRSRRMRVRTFCVERGRWQERAGEESPNTFKSSAHAAASRELKLSIRHARSQAAVWSGVEAAHAKLSRAVGRDVRAPRSPSSLPLAVENDAVRRRVAGYVDALGNLLADQPDAVGFAFAINGRLNSADLYASPELFRKLWPKLLDAAALEALAEASTPGVTCAVPGARDVSAWLRRARRGRKTRRAVTPRVTLVVRETAGQVSFETIDADQSNLCVHQNILAQ